MTAPQQPYGSDQPQNPYGAPPSPQGGYPPAPGGYPQQGGGFGVDPYGQPLSDKSKIVAGLLQIFLGAFGIGRFYLGYTGIAIAQIAVTWLTLGIGGIWPFIDGILMILGKVPDSQGRKLRD